MFVNEIKEINKSKCEVILDSGESFALYKGEIRMLKIKAQTEITEDTYNAIYKGVLTKRCKLRAMNLLKSRDYTEYQLRKKLEANLYPKGVIDEAVAYVKSFNYVNDAEYAKAFTREQSQYLSKAQIKQKLLMKGVEKELISRALNEVYSDESDSSDTNGLEEELIVKTLKKRGFNGNEDYEERQKVLAYFYRRGFDVDKVRNAMERFRSED